MIQAWSTITLEALQGTWQGFLLYLPKLIGAIVIFVIGWFFSIGIGKLIAEILNRLRFNKLFEKTGWAEALEKAELKINVSDFIGVIFKWILIIVFLLVAVEILGFSQFANFLREILAWLPNLIVAAAIFVVAIIVADIFEKLVKVSVRKIGVKHVEFLGAAVRWSIYIFAALAILLQLGVTTTIVNALIIGLVGMISLAFGLSFGLGGKDAAARVIEEFRQKISEK